MNQEELQMQTLKELRKITQLLKDTIWILVNPRHSNETMDEYTDRITKLQTK